jgi:hypothetical protein
VRTEAYYIKDIHKEEGGKDRQGRNNCEERKRNRMKHSKKEKTKYPFSYCYDTMVLSGTAKGSS